MSSCDGWGWVSRLSFCGAEAIQLSIFCFIIQAIATSLSVTATASPSPSSSPISTTFIWFSSPISPSLFDGFSLSYQQFYRSRNLLLRAIWWRCFPGVETWRWDYRPYPTILNDEGITVRKVSLFVVRVAVTFIAVVLSSLAYQFADFVVSTHIKEFDLFTRYNYKPKDYTDSHQNYFLFNTINLY